MCNITKHMQHAFNLNPQGAAKLCCPAVPEVRFSLLCLHPGRAAEKIWCCACCVNRNLHMWTLQCSKGTLHKIFSARSLPQRTRDDVKTWLTAVGFPEARLLLKLLKLKVHQALDWGQPAYHPHELLNCFAWQVAAAAWQRNVDGKMLQFLGKEGLLWARTALQSNKGKIFHDGACCSSRFYHHMGMVWQELRSPAEQRRLARIGCQQCSGVCPDYE